MQTIPSSKEEKEFELPEPTKEQKEEFQKVKQEAIDNYLDGKPTEMV